MHRLSLLIGLALAVGCNEAPIPSTATISPTAPTTLEDLRLVIGEATDPNRSDSPIQLIRWALNGEEIPTLDDRTVIPSTMTAAGDIWTAKIIATDGDLESAPRTVSTTVLNTLAEGTVRFEDETPTPGDALVAVATFADIDDHEVELTWHWAVDGQSAGYDEQTIPAGMTQKGEMWTVSVVGFDGAESSDAVQRSVVIGNSAPIVGSVTLGPDDAVAGEDLVVTVAATDADADPITFRYSWTVDGEPVEGTSGELDGSQLTRGQQIDVWVTATDGTASSQPIRASATINNSRPTVAAASIDRDQATAQDALTCIAEGVADADNDEVEVHYSWSVNDVIVGSEERLEVATSRGDVVACTLVVSDDSADSLRAISPRLTISNAVPTDRGIQFTTDAPVAGADIGVAFIDPFDFDGDDLVPVFAWTVDDKAAQEGPWLNAGEFVRGNLIVITAMLTDGIDQSESRTAQFTVANAPPVVQDVILSGSPTSGDLTASVAATDADNDDITTTYHWHINGSPAGVTTETLPGNATQRDDQVFVGVTVHDGMGGVTQAQSGIISVGNREPVLGAVSIDAASASVGDVVAAVFAPASDPDGDTISYTFSWQIDGTEVGNEPTLTLPQSGGGEHLTVIVTPADSFGAGTGISSQPIPIANEAPTVTSVTLTPETGATANSVLALNWAATDPEDDELDVTILWHVNGTIQSISSMNFPVREYASAGDNVRAEVSVSDGTHTSEFVSSSTITIENSAPEPLELSFEPSMLQPDAALKCVVNGLFDVDGDDISVDITWLADGELYVGETTNGSYEGDTLSADTVGLYETWECQASASDGTAASTTQAIDDDVNFGSENIIGQYTTDSHVLYRIRSTALPETGAQVAYAQACTEVGAMPVSCDAAEFGSDYDASAYGAVAFDTATYSCDISAAVSDLTGWQGLVSFHQPALDPRGVCEEGCVEDSPIAYPLCVVVVDLD